MLHTKMFICVICMLQLSLLSATRIGLIQEVILENEKDTTVMPFPRSMSSKLKPSRVNQIENFDSVAKEQNKYMQRVRGFFKAPETGEYKFYSSCSGPCQVSIGQDPTLTPRKIISQKEESLHNEFDRYSDQVSHAIYLEKDKLYFIEGVEKQNAGLGHLSVGVVFPSDKKVFPISKSYLRTDSRGDLERKEEISRHGVDLAIQRDTMFEKLHEINEYIKDLTDEVKRKSTHSDVNSNKSTGDEKDTNEDETLATMKTSSKYQKTGNSPESNDNMNEEKVSGNLLENSKDVTQDSNKENQKFSSDGNEGLVSQSFKDTNRPHQSTEHGETDVSNDANVAAMHTDERGQHLLEKTESTEDTSSRAEEPFRITQSAQQKFGAGLDMDKTSPNVNKIENEQSSLTKEGTKQANSDDVTNMSSKLENTVHSSDAKEATIESGKYVTRKVPMDNAPADGTAAVTTTNQPLISDQKHHNAKNVEHFRVMYTTGNNKPSVTHIGENDVDGDGASQQIQGENTDGQSLNKNKTITETYGKTQGETDRINTNTADQKDISFTSPNSGYENQQETDNNYGKSKNEMQSITKEQSSSLADANASSGKIQDKYKADDNGRQENYPSNNGPGTNVFNTKDDDSSSMVHDLGAFRATSGDVSDIAFTSSKSGNKGGHDGAHMNGQSDINSSTDGEDQRHNSVNENAAGTKTANVLETNKLDNEGKQFATDNEGNSQESKGLHPHMYNSNERAGTSSDANPSSISDAKAEQPTMTQSDKTATDSKNTFGHADHSDQTEYSEERNANRNTNKTSSTLQIVKNEPEVSEVKNEQNTAENVLNKQEKLSFAQSEGGSTENVNTQPDNNQVTSDISNQNRNDKASPENRIKNTDENEEEKPGKKTSPVLDNQLATSSSSNSGEKANEEKNEEQAVVQKSQRAPFTSRDKSQSNKDELTDSTNENVINHSEHKQFGKTEKSMEGLNVIPHIDSVMKSNDESASIVDNNMSNDDKIGAVAAPSEQLLSKTNPLSQTLEFENTNHDEDDVMQLANYARQEISRHGSLSEAVIRNLVKILKQKILSNGLAKLDGRQNVAERGKKSDGEGSTKMATNRGKVSNVDDKSSESKADVYDRVISNLMKILKKNLLPMNINDNSEQESTGYTANTKDTNTDMGSPKEHQKVNKINKSKGEREKEQSSQILASLNRLNTELQSMKSYLRAEQLPVGHNDDYESDIKTSFQHSQIPPDRNVTDQNFDAASSFLRTAGKLSLSTILSAPNFIRHDSNPISDTISVKGFSKSSGLQDSEKSGTVTYKPEKTKDITATRKDSDLIANPIMKNPVNLQESDIGNVQELRNLDESNTLGLPTEQLQSQLFGNGLAKAAKRMSVTAKTLKKTSDSKWVDSYHSKNSLMGAKSAAAFNKVNPNSIDKNVLMDQNIGPYVPQSPGEQSSPPGRQTTVVENHVQREDLLRRTNNDRQISRAGGTLAVTGDAAVKNKISRNNNWLQNPKMENVLGDTRSLQHVQSSSGQIYNKLRSQQDRVYYEQLLQNNMPSLFKQTLKQNIPERQKLAEHASTMRQSKKNYLERGTLYKKQIRPIAERRYGNIQSGSTRIRGIKNVLGSKKTIIAKHKKSKKAARRSRPASI